MSDELSRHVSYAADRGPHDAPPGRNLRGRSRRNMDIGRRGAATGVVGDVKTRWHPSEGKVDTSRTGNRPAREAKLVEQGGPGRGALAQRIERRGVVNEDKPAATGEPGRPVA